MVLDIVDRPQKEVVRLASSRLHKISWLIIFSAAIDGAMESARSATSTVLLTWTDRHTIPLRGLNFASNNSAEAEDRRRREAGSQ